MEISVIQSRTYSTILVPPKTNFSTSKLKRQPHLDVHNMELNRTILKIKITKSNYTERWNNTDFYYNVSNSTDLDYDYQMMNGTIDDSPWAACKEWTPAQHSLFQTANFFFAAAFIVPGSFKQSVLLVRALLSFGYFFLAVWGGVEVCAPDILLWNVMIVIVNFTHTALLTWRFLPPTLTLDLTELYIKIFKPLSVSKKHFKELVKEAKVQTLECGDIYAVENVSPADERLSILLKGRMRVTCDDTHLHFINQHQFVDSPEWEANHEQSDDVFQVTITAEEDCTYLCWSRMKLERVLRHRPMLKVVLDAIIGKDITQKLYALNEHLSGLTHERNRDKRNALWAKTHCRSMSMDAVNTGTTGLVRSQAYKLAKYKDNTQSNTKLGSTGRLPAQGKQSWVPLVATQFPKKSPFIQQNSTTSLQIPEVHMTPQRSKSLKGPKKEREVKFQAPIK
ncbi:blood vessel epicardial substance-B-like [Euwallacea similis]|uniref:blood vessel epicardial substance-B-like n=1 Tax=Euwallacea similis TaxID=1736056 RepID=UPI00344C09D5